MLCLLCTRGKYERVLVLYDHFVALICIVDFRSVLLAPLQLCKAHNIIGAARVEQDCARVRRRQPCGFGEGGIRLTGAAASAP